MKKFTIFSIVIITTALSFISSIANAQDYYWVGGTGNWSDFANHWATTSGGSTFQTIEPQPTNNVYFDVNSFLSANDTVYIDMGYTECANFTMNGITNTPTFTNTSAVIMVEVHGDFILNPNCNWKDSCDFWLVSPQPSSVIETNGLTLTNDVHAQAVSYTLLGDFHDTKALFIDDGSFFTAGYNIDSYWLYVNTGYPVNLGTSTISTWEAGFYNNNTGTPPLFADSATVHTSLFDVGTSVANLSFNNLWADNINASNCTFKNVTGTFIHINGDLNLFQNVSGDIDESFFISSIGMNHFVHATVPSQFNTNGNLIIDTVIFLNPGAGLSMNFYQSDTIFLTGEMIFNYSGGIAKNAGGLDTGYIYSASGSICFGDTITFSQIATIGGATFYAGANSVDYGNNRGMEFLNCGGSGGVWPGDANDDLIVDNFDVLALGVYFGNTAGFTYGTAGANRPFASTNWETQWGNTWSSNQSNGVDQRFADCDGNGVIDSLDLDVVNLNYGFTHPLRLSKPTPVYNSSLPELTLTATPDTTNASSAVNMDIDLGINANPMVDMYGIVFSITYDTQLVNPDSITVDFSNSWLGTAGADMITFSKLLSGSGRIDFALTRIDGADISGGIGHLCSLRLVTADNVPVQAILHLHVAGAYYIDVANLPIALLVSGDSVLINSSVGLNNISENNFSVYPNPTSGKIFIRNNMSYSGENNLEIYNNLGEKVYNSIVTETETKISMVDFTAGIYLLKITSGENIITKKIVIAAH